MTAARILSSVLGGTQIKSKGGGSVLAPENLIMIDHTL